MASCSITSLSSTGARDVAPFETDPHFQSLRLEEVSSHVSAWLLQHLWKLMSQGLVVLEVVRVGGRNIRLTPSAEWVKTGM